MKFRYIALAAALCLALTGCQNTDSQQEQDQTASSSAVSTGLTDPAGLFSDRDLAGTYDESQAVSITLTGESAQCDSSAVSISGSQIVISDEGVYLVSGTLSDGQIVINAQDTDKVQIVLSGADITSSTSAAIYALEADKVFITLAAGTENTLTNGGEYVAIDENNIDGVIFAKTDLTLNGSGSLTINAQAGHGVVSKDDLVVGGGTYTITAASHGLSGKDSVAIADGSMTITSGKDGIHAENTDDETLGFLYIADGTVTIDAQGDAISASGALQVDGGSFDLTAGGGSATVTLTASSGLEAGGRGGWAAQTQQTTTDDTQEDSTSQKGIKAEGSLTLSAGSFAIDTADDGIHAGGDLVIAAGDFTLSSGDDAIHSDSAVTIQGGTFVITYCYEGIEGLSVTIDDGTFDITSYDDGLNAAGGADSSGFGGMRQEQFSSGSDSFILINAGTFTIVSSGDCLDSNGDLTINGGTLNLTCNGSGNTALDCDGTYTHNGGDVTTNDGSESNPGGMEGGRGGQMGELPKGTGDFAGRGTPPEDVPTV